MEERAERSVSASKGRSPTPLVLSSSGVYAVGTYLCRDGCRMGLVNLRGEVSCQRALTPEEIRQPETALERIAFLVRDILNDSGVPSERLLGLGLSCPGPVDAGAGRLLDPPDLKHGTMSRSRIFWCRKPDSMCGSKTMPTASL